MMLLVLVLTIFTTVAVNANLGGKSADYLTAYINDPNEPERAFVGEDPNEPEPERAFIGEDPNEPEPERAFIDGDPNEPEPESALIVDLIGCLGEDPNEPEPESVFLLRNW